MTVSNEDRDPLVHTLSIEDYMATATGLRWTPGYYQMLANAARNWLIAHGWGPRLVMSKREIERRIYYAYRASSYDGIDDRVLSAVVSAAVGAVTVTGIEVTDDRPE